MAFTVIYYAGGSASGEWRKTAPVATEAEAIQREADLERAGRPAMRQRSEVWDAIGLPSGAPHWWDFAKLARA